MSPSMSRTPSAPPGSPASRSASRGCGTCRTRRSGWPSCCRRTRPSTPASATPSGSTPRRAPSSCCGRCTRRGTTSADGSRRLDGLDGDALVHRLIAAGGHDVEWLTEEQLAAAPARVPLERYRAWLDAVPAELRDGIVEHWGEAPGSLYVDGDDIVLASLTFGNVVLMIQPPRGFGENPVAIYHDPDLPPSHHYVAAYRWLEATTADGGFGADAVDPPRQARHAGVAARQGPGAVGGVRAGRRPRRPAAGVPVHRQRPGRGHAGQAARARHRRRPPGAADGAGRHVRRPGQAGAAARRVRERRRRSTRRSCRRCARRSGR